MWIHGTSSWPNDECRRGLSHVRVPFLLLSSVQLVICKCRAMWSPGPKQRFKMSVTRNKIIIGRTACIGASQKPRQSCKKPSPVCPTHHLLCESIEGTYQLSEVRSYGMLWDQICSSGPQCWEVLIWGGNRHHAQGLRLNDPVETDCLCLH